MKINKGINNTLEFRAAIEGSMHQLWRLEIYTCIRYLIKSLGIFDRKHETVDTKHFQILIYFVLSIDKQII